MLLPIVRDFTHQTGHCLLPGSLSAEAQDERVVRAARRWLDTLSATDHAATLIIIEEPDILPHPDGYRLSVQPDRIMLRGASAAGCFHGLQTLAQLAGGGAGLPICEITDWPDFSVRGLLHDTTRGKVPTLATLKLLADRLASLKANQLQLYIEHSFTFAFDPEIATEQNALTPDEIRELDAHCHERFITLVPAVATLGHMGRILSLPRYRHLAEIAPEVSWEELAWPQRARGFTLDILNPESRALVETIWNEILDAFSSPVVNICGDEPWDLGKGRNRDRLTEKAIGAAYIDHILRTHEICARRGRTTQVWSDVVTKHPEQFHRLPRDLAILHWGYDDKSDYAGTRRFVDAGLETICCPGTTGWKRVLNAMDLAERNISTFARAGRDCGATGLLNTDWGDHGHFNALACSWHAIALGAACGWRADHPTGPDFDARFSDWLIRSADDSAPQSHSLSQNAQRNQQIDPVRELVAALRQTSAIGERCETWRLLWQPMEQVRDDATLPPLNEANHADEWARQAVDRLSTMGGSCDFDELQTACLATRLFCAKMRGARGESLQSSDLSQLSSVVSARFSAEWNERNKPSGLADVQAALRRLSLELMRNPK